jgi:hypothetical protein
MWRVGGTFFLQSLLLPFSSQTAAELWLLVHELSFLSAWLSSLEQHPQLENSDVAIRNGAWSVYQPLIDSIATDVGNIATGTAGVRVRA